MKFYKCINEVKPSYVAGTEPQFSETVLYQNQTSTGEATITLSDNYHNYDIIKFICCDTNTDNSLSSYYTTPATMDHMVADNPYINCNVMNTNHFVTCTIASNTQLTNCTHSRYLYVTKIIGLNCSNGTLVETEIYSGFRTSSWFSIETELNLFDFNMILAQTCTSSYDENNITNNIYIRPNNNLYLGNTDIANQLTEWRVSYYGNSYVTNITEHTISSGKWYYVCGLKFIPKWDYYIENLIFNGTSSTVIDTELSIFSEANKDRDFEIEFKDNGTKRVGENWYSYFSVFDNSYIYYEYITFLGTSMGRFASLTDYQAIKNESPQTVIDGTENAALGNGKTVRIVKQGNKFTVYYNNNLVQTRTFSNGMPSTDANLKLGIGKRGSTTYYGNQNSGFKYFGFRWLS